MTLLSRALVALAVCAACSSKAHEPAYKAHARALRSTYAVKLDALASHKIDFAYKINKLDPRSPEKAAVSSFSDRETTAMIAARSLVSSLDILLDDRHLRMTPEQVEQRLADVEPRLARLVAEIETAQREEENRLAAVDAAPADAAAPAPSATGSTAASAAGSAK